MRNAEMRKRGNGICPARAKPSSDAVKKRSLTLTSPLLALQPSLKMGDFINLTLDDEQSRDSSGSPLNRSDASYIKQAADFDDLSNLDLPPVKSEPADFSDSDCVMISSADSLSDRHLLNICIK